MRRDLSTMAEAVAFIREMQGTVQDLEYLMDDLLFCVEHPDEDPCRKRKSTRTREQTLTDAMEVRGILRGYGRMYGGKKR